MEWSAHVCSQKKTEPNCTRFHQNMEQSCPQQKLVPQMPYMTSVIVRESDLIAIKYQDVYHIDHTVYYLDSSPISAETFNKLNKIRQLVPPGIYSVDKIDLNNILRGILQFRFEKHGKASYNNDTRYQHTTRL